MNNADSNLHVVVVAELDHDLEQVMVFSSVSIVFFLNAKAVEVDHFAENIEVGCLHAQLLDAKFFHLLSIDSLD